MNADEFENPSVDGRPDRRGVVGGRRRFDGLSRQRRHVEHRRLDLHIERPFRRRVDDLNVATSRAGQETRHQIEGPRRSRKADALNLLAGELHHTFDGKGQVGAALGPDDGVNLVDDHGVDAAQDFAGVRGEDQEERLGSGDEDVGRIPSHLLAFVLRRIARPHGHAGDAEGIASFLRQRADAREGFLQVALDILREGLDRGDVEDANGARPPRTIKNHTVNRAQEGGQSLSGSRRGGDQRRLAGQDVRPGLPLRRRRRFKAASEPLARRWMHFRGVAYNPPHLPSVQISDARGGPL